MTSPGGNKAVSQDQRTNEDKLVDDLMFRGVAWSRKANAEATAVARPLGVQPVPKAAMTAATKLRDTIKTRPNKRAVHVETSIGGNGEFVYTLIVSVDPSTGVAVLLSEIDGYPVRVEPWPY